MKKITTFLITLSLSLMSLSVSAIDAGNLVRAQAVLGQVSKIVSKYDKVQTLINAGKIDLRVPDPIDGSDGDYMFPFTKEGSLTSWGEKALTAQAGAQAGDMAADQGMKVIASSIPFGGLFSGAAKKKAKSAGAVLAIGGWDFIKENTELSFEELSDLSVYMHSKFYGDPNYETALAASMAVYPDLEKGHEKAIKRAYKKAKKRARKLPRT